MTKKTMLEKFESNLIDDFLEIQVSSLKSMQNFFKAVNEPFTAIINENKDKYPDDVEPEKVIEDGASDMDASDYEYLDDEEFLTFAEIAPLMSAGMAFVNPCKGVEKIDLGVKEEIKSPKIEKKKSNTEKDKQTAA